MQTLPAGADEEKGGGASSSRSRLMPSRDRRRSTPSFKGARRAPRGNSHQAPTTNEVERERSCARKEEVAARLPLTRRCHLGREDTANREERQKERHCR